MRRDILLAERRFDLAAAVFNYQLDAAYDTRVHLGLSVLVCMRMFGLRRDVASNNSV